MSPGFFRRLSPFDATGCTAKHALGSGQLLRRVPNRKKKGVWKGTKEIFVKRFHRIRAKLRISVRSEGFIFRLRESVPDAKMFTAG